MRAIPVYQIDAFASEIFSGNPAAVCLLSRWLDDATMQGIAAENNLAETAFVVPSDGAYELRWFTPITEVDLCGHATLACAHLLLNVLGRCRNEVSFDTRSGRLDVARNGDLLALDLPTLAPRPAEPPDALVEGLGCNPQEVLAATNYLAVFADEEEVRSIEPDFGALAKCHPYGVIVTATGKEADFVSRFFAPSYGIDEDPVTGSAHCTLTPYWAGRLGKKQLRAKQISRRGGELGCEHRGRRTRVSGRCALYLRGTIELP